MSKTLLYKVSLLLLSMVLALLVGFWLGIGTWLAFLLLLAYGTFQLYRLQLLFTWVKGGDQVSTAFKKGLFSELVEDIDSVKKQGLAQKESVKHQLERFKTLISVFPDGVVILSESNEIQWFNEQASTLLLLKKSDAGQIINHLVRHPLFTKLLGASDNGAGVVIESPASVDGWTASKVEVRVMPYTKGSRLLLVRDVTKVERVNQMRKDFISNASHELRTPLTVMKGYVEMLLASSMGDNKTVDHSLKKIDQQVLKMQTMIDELLQLSKLEEGHRGDTDTTLSLSNLFEQLNAELQTLAQRKKQRLTFDVASGCSLKGDKNSFLTIMRNLISNAIHYTSDAGDISVSWTVDQEGRGTLSVKDTGEGISERHISRLTERFYRVPENNLMNKGGTGLGLAIVKHELERHDACLVVESIVGEGSNFKCLLPAGRTIN